MELHFTKMNGAGNDFVMIDNRDGNISLTSEQISHVCDRHRGVGADGLLMVEAASNGADYRMRYFNADGGEAEMCGNGARCFARFALRADGGRETADRVNFETPAGLIAARVAGDEVELAMSVPKDLTAPVNLTVNEALVDVHFVNTGVPHAVIFVNDLGSADVLRLGAGIRHHDHFAPKGTNVNFVEVISPGELAIRTYERGVENETLACGTGVVASALIHHVVDAAAAPIRVRVLGGDTLSVGFNRTESGAFDHVTLTGPADFTFDGRVQV